MRGDEEARLFEGQGRHLSTVKEAIKVESDGENNSLRAVKRYQNAW